MLPLDVVHSRVNSWRQASWPIRGGILLPVAVVLTIGWPAMVGAGYGVVVWSRLHSVRARYALVSLMAISSLLAQGAWTRWMIEGILAARPAGSPVAETVSSSPASGEVAGVSNSATTHTGQVLQVIDGAHLQVSILDQAYTVELIGLVPNDSQLESPACLSQEAKQYLEGLVGQGQVQLTADGQLTDRNDWGQMLRYVTAPDGSLVNRQMIDAGMAVVQSGPPAYEQQVAFMGAEAAAKAASRGVWGSCAAPTPSPTPSENTTSKPPPTITVTQSVASVVQPVIPTPAPSIKLPAPTAVIHPPTPTSTPSPTSTPTPTPAVSTTPSE